MSLKHRKTVRSMPGEVIIAPAEATGAVKVRIEGTHILSSCGFYFIGFNDNHQEPGDALKKTL